MPKKKNPVGAPRTVSPPKEDMIKLGKEMVAWVKANEPDVFHLSQWYTIEKMFTYNQWKGFLQFKEFLPYYEIALKIVGKKYIDGTVNPAIAQRWQRSYFKDLREEEDQDVQDKLDRELAHKKRVIEHEVETKAASEISKGIAPNDQHLVNILKELKKSNAK